MLGYFAPSVSSCEKPIEFLYILQAKLALVLDTS